MKSKIVKTNKPTSKPVVSFPTLFISDDGEIVFADTETTGTTIVGSHIGHRYDDTVKWVDSRVWTHVTEPTTVEFIP